MIKHKTNGWKKIKTNPTRIKKEKGRSDYRYNRF